MMMIQVMMFKVDTNTVASVVLQSGARWLGLTLDMIGAVIVTIVTIPYHTYHTIP